MNMQSLERVRQQWELAADSTPQFICLLDRDGRVLRANRTLERWKPGIDIGDAGGLCLHDVLHRDCGDSRCYLRRFGERAVVALTKGRNADCDVWDPILERQFLIRARRPVLTPRRKDFLSEVFAVVTVDDVTEFKAEEALRASRTELRRLAARHLTIQEAERRRIAAELHDGLGQSLSLLKLGIQEALTQMGARAPRKAVESVQQLLPKVAGALDELHRVSMDLSPSILDDLGLLPTLSWFVRDFESTKLKTRIEKDISVSEKDVPEPLRIAIFRILQEAVDNAVKHAGAECIRVGLHNGGDVLAFSIEDDGKGFDAGALANRGNARSGLGLQSMRERAELSGGTCAITSALGQGTKVCVRWPASEVTDADREQAGYAFRGPQSGATVEARDAGAECAIKDARRSGRVQLEE